MATDISRDRVDEIVDERLRREDRERRVLFWSMPSGLYLLGALAHETRNLMTLNWACQIASTPKLIGVSIEQNARSHWLVEESGLFTLSVLDREDRTVVRKFVKPAADDRDAMTLSGVSYVDATVTKLPVLKSALGYFECAVRDVMRFESHSLFVGEVVGVMLSERLNSSEQVEVLAMNHTRMNYGG